jgi:hypothetical protein
MAGFVELQITVKGEPIEYDPWTYDDVDAAGKILCTTFELIGTAGVDPKTGKPQGTRDYGAGVKVTKRLDATSPTLLDLFAKSVGLTAVFTFSSPDVSSKAQANQPTLTVTIGKPPTGSKGSKLEAYAWLRGYTLIAPDTDVAASTGPQEPYEELYFSFTTIEYHRSGEDNGGNNVNKIAFDDLARFGAA